MTFGPGWGLAGKREEGDIAIQGTQDQLGSDVDFFVVFGSGKEESLDAKDEEGAVREAKRTARQKQDPDMKAVARGSVGEVVVWTAGSYLEELEGA